MSNYLAVATVTAALGDILQDAAKVVDGATVTMRRPENISGTAPDQATINLFLYQASPNPAWNNIDLPTRSLDGRLVQRPVVALDLDYLLSFHGSEIDMVPQRLLGSAVISLHAQPVLAPDTISHVSNGILQHSDLLAQTERVRFWPLNLSLEELSKLWSVFFQIPYTLSMAYRASAVLLEPDVAIPEVKLVTRRIISAEAPQ